jgi:hypothetical protein
MTVDTRLVAVGVALLLFSSLLFLPTGVGAKVSIGLAALAGVGVLVAALGGRDQRTA